MCWINNGEQKMNQELNEKYLAQIKTCKDESDHEDADYILCGLLEELGYKELVAAYREVPKWYS